LLGVTLAAVTALSTAESYYARGWQPKSIGQSIAYLQAAHRAYPFLPRFREGVGKRLQVYAVTGK
jgi:hypothetical protein